VADQARCRSTRFSSRTALALRMMRIWSHGIGRADELCARSETGSAQDAHHPAALGAANLHNGAEFLVEQGAHQQLERAAAEQIGALLVAVDVIAQGVIAEAISVDRNAAVGGKSHLADGGEQPSVRAVVVGEQQIVGGESAVAASKNAGRRVGSSTSGASLPVAA
jgi:hypothetical protein